MKETKRILSLLLVAAMLAAMFCTVLVGCDKGDKKPSEKPTSAPTSAPTETPTEAPVDNSKISYKVNVKSAGGMALKDVMVFIYNGENIVGYITTDETGTGTTELPKNDAYKAVVTTMPEGYKAEESYAFVNGTAEVILTSGVVVGENAPATYKLGSIMHDFTIKKYDDGEELTLSEVLKEKKMVLINYWYDGCVYCLQEFPEIDDENRKLALSIRAIEEAEKKAAEAEARAAEKAARDAERAEEEKRIAEERADMAPYIVGSI